MMEPETARDILIAFTEGLPIQKRGTELWQPTFWEDLNATHGEWPYDFIANDYRIKPVDEPDAS